MEIGFRLLPNPVLFLFNILPHKTTFLSVLFTFYIYNGDKVYQYIYPVIFSPIEFRHQI